jgi:hypothetical protein
MRIFVATIKYTYTLIDYIYLRNRELEVLINLDDLFLLLLSPLMYQKKHTYMIYEKEPCGYTGLKLE